MLSLLLLACTKAPIPTVSVRTTDLGHDLRAELISDGTVEARLAEPDDAEIVIYYMGEQKGSLAPCGCPDRPRGGLPRAASYIEKASPGIILNAGYWTDDGQGIDGNPRADATLKNQWMMRGLEALPVNAVHVSFNDLFGLATIPEDAPNLPLVSANISGPGIEPFVIIHQNGHRIGVTGISHPGHPSVATPGFVRSQPTTSAAPIIETLHASTDAVILFAHGATEAAKKLVRSGHVDVVIDTNEHRSFEPPFRVGNAVWVRSYVQGMQLGELRLGEVKDGMRWAFDRKIDLDDGLPNHHALNILNEEAKAEIEVLENALFNR